MDTKCAWTTCVWTRGVFGLITLALAAPPGVQAHTAVLDAAKDNTVFSESASTSLGAGQHVFTGRTDGGNLRRGLIAFDIAGQVPAGATITSVVLRLNMSLTIAGDQSVGLHRLQRDWGEAGSTGFVVQEGTGGLALPGDATWTHTFFNTGNWANVGGDFDPAPSAVQTVGGAGLYTWSGATLVADVQTWLDTPAVNFGWLLLGNEAVLTTAKRFDSRQHGTPANRPQLYVGYDPPPPPPPLGPIVMTARLDGLQEVPPVPTPATGIALVSYDRPTRTLTYYVQHSVASPTVAHIHGPAGEGTNAPPVITFASAVSPIRGDAVLSPAEARDLEDGRYYINVHSVLFPAGEIRGQLLARAAFGGRLDGAQEVPPVATAASGAAHLEYDFANAELHYWIEHDVSQPTAAHIHGPALAGVNAGILVDLGSGANPIQGSASLSVPDAAALLNGFGYVNIHSVPFPGGEIRGQLEVVGAVPPATLAARLDAVQEVPPQPNAFTGAAMVAFERATRRLQVVLAHDVPDATMAHIHGPAAPGVNGPIVFDLGAPESPIGGTFTLTPAEADALLTGLYYFNVHSVAFPAGAIRGQILPEADFTAVLQSRQETPRQTTRRHGVGHFTYDPPTRLLSYWIVHDMTNLTAAHIHGPADPGLPAGILYPLPAPSPMIGSVTIDPAHVPALRAGRLYVNVHSPAYPAGEIRGQILPAEPVPHPTHAARLTGDAEVPPVPTANAGLGIFAYDCATRLLEYDIQHTLTNVISAHIHGPAGAGTNAPVVFAFPEAANPIQGRVPLTAVQAADFLAGLHYVNVHSTDHPGGEIRGQILPTAWRFAATLQGRQETAHPPTAALGQGLFAYDPSTLTLDYRIEHTLTTVNAGHIHGPADPGVNAGIVHGFGAPASPIVGQVVLTPDQAVELLRGRYYVNLHSPAHPAGEIRGQILETRPDSDCNGIDDHWALDRGLVPGHYNAQEDPDDDGHNTWQEYVADTDPADPTSVAAFAGFIHGPSTTVSFATSPLRRYGVWSSTNLVAGAWRALVAPPVFGTGGLLEVTDTNAPPAAFFRFDIHLP